MGGVGEWVGGGGRTANNSKVVVVEGIENEQRRGDCFCFVGDYGPTAVSEMTKKQHTQHKHARAGGGVRVEKTGSQGETDPKKGTTDASSMGSVDCLWVYKVYCIFSFFIFFL